MVSTMLKTAVLVGAIGAGLIGGAHAQFDCTAAEPKTAQNLIDAGFGVGTMHIKTSGGCGFTGNNALYYKVAGHADVGGDFQIQVEYCDNGDANDNAACGKDILYPNAWTCLTTGLQNDLYGVTDGPNPGIVQTYCLGQAQEKELAALNVGCTADGEGTCTAFDGIKYNCLVPGLEVCGGSPPDHDHSDSTAAPTTAAPYVETDGCASGLNCGTGAACVDVTDSGTDYTCVCGTGYSGTQTSNTPAACTDINGCDGDTCGADHVCTDAVAPSTGFTCACGDGYTGDPTTGAAPTCTDVNECGVASNCANGVCGNTNGGYTCACYTGWSGDKCDVNIDYCTTSAPTTIYVGERDGAPDHPNPDWIFYRNAGCTDVLETIATETGLFEDRTHPLSENTQYTFTTCMRDTLQWNHNVKIYSVTDEEDVSGFGAAGLVSGSNNIIITTGSVGELLRYQDPLDPFFGYFKAVAFADGCQNGALCADGNTTYTCECPTGYEETYCETDTDECASNNNFGVCVVANTNLCKESNDDGSINLGAYECDCKDGWVDQNCQTDDNECAGGDPDGIGQCVAANTISCTDAAAPLTGFTCNCKDGYMGQTCADDINECKDNSGRGSCGNADQVQECQDSISHPDSVDVDAYNCVCKDGWSKDPNTGHCTVDVDECEANEGQGSCKNSATCTDSINSDVDIDDYHCACESGWEGKNCDQSDNDCLRLISDPNQTCDVAGGDCANPCVHSDAALGGKCEDGHEDYTCTCEIDTGKTVSGWTGENCHLSVDDCNPNGQGNPCKHGVTCNDDHYGHSCKCDETNPLHYNAHNEVNCDTLVVQGCMDPKKFNYDPAANHDDYDKCVGTFEDQYDDAKNGGINKRKGRVKKFMEMQDRKAKVTRNDGKNHGIIAERIQIRKLDRIKIKLDDFKLSVRTKPVFEGKSLKMEVGPVNKAGEPDAATENCAAKTADYKSGDESCITTMLDEEEQDASDGNKMTLTRRVVPCVGCWQVAGKTVGNKSMPIFKQTKTYKGAEDNDDDDDKYTMSCWDEPSKTWEQVTTDVKEGDDFQCTKTRHRVIVGGLTDNPASCVGLLDGGCTSEQKTEVYLSRTDGDTDCSGATKDSDRSWEVGEANTEECKTLGCTTQQIVDSFTCS